MTGHPNPELPFLDALVVVEGFRDQQAVARAVNATVARAQNGTPVPEGVDIGVEHASPEAVAEALLNPKMSTRGRDDITWDDLEDLRLVQSCGVRGDDVRARRTFFCGELGIGFCDGSVLVKQVNRYGFTWTDVTKAHRKCEVRLQDWLKDKEAAAQYEATKNDFEESSDDEPI